MAESSDVPAMSHFKVLLKAHTVPRLLTGHKGDVYVAVRLKRERDRQRKRSVKRKRMSVG